MTTGSSSKLGMAVVSTLQLDIFRLYPLYTLFLVDLIVYQNDLLFVDTARISINQSINLVHANLLVNYILFIGNIYTTVFRVKRLNNQSVRCFNCLTGKTVV